jgi:hypothetical protein
MLIPVLMARPALMDLVSARYWFDTRRLSDYTANMIWIKKLGSKRSS